MPRQGNNLTRRKGSSAVEQSARPTKTNVAVDLSDGDVTPSKRVKTNIEAPADAFTISQHEHIPLDVIELLPAAPSRKKIVILQNILILPAHNLKKGKPTVSYCTVHVSDVRHNDHSYMVSKPKNYVQNAVQLIASNKHKASSILKELSLEHMGPLIMRMVDIFPTSKADHFEADCSSKDILSLQEKIISTSPLHTR